mmetsp:Transcript_18167/g.27423  ORF Transcript_18167/g.27423 Transcript_18167/m.27423 type:complete len:103 (-) Transcript_18167:340-648(-)|eukprot:CAMPEP_0194577542 /NCGR_PEP_ID=MMETSP0292-20121207/12289_1 /TAXON_ID=39354 /ORGANISM="Heterosigma akashiwo, Strain CCMP2393" /LENGTH=102 /DNA_ID=CAMNT_0039429959 /DNA_START=175 /DNA_END=483 /DNA_ORIENTATION=-
MSLSKSSKILLDYFKKLPSSGTFLPFFQSQFQSISDAPGSTESKTKEALLKDYAHLLSSVQEQKRLRELYAGELMTQEERIKRSAQRVGLSVPKQFVEDGTG